MEKIQIKDSRIHIFEMCFISFMSLYFGMCFALLLGISYSWKVECILSSVLYLWKFACFMLGFRKIVSMELC